MEFNDMIELGADQLLNKAEKLLLDVSNCIKPTAPRTIDGQSRIVNDLILNSDSDNKSFNSLNHESDYAQIEWLLRGVPEAYDCEPHVDDDMVMALLKEGGNPPAQLVLPSIYATNQLILQKLSHAKRLRISFTNFLVLSIRYGVRKDGTFLRVYPPSGCNLPANEAGSIMIPLTELKDPNSQIGQLLRKNDKRDSLRNYFVGAIDLSYSFELELSMSEKVVREWIHSTPTGSLRIELYGYLSPHTTVVRGTLAEAVLLANAVVPLGGLLGTASLDAVAHCDLTVDAYSHATVLSRMRGISSGQIPTKAAKALGPKLGTLTVRVSVLAGEAPSSPSATQAQASASTRDVRLLHEVAPLLVPVVESVQPEDGYGSFTHISPRAVDDKIHAALAYVPFEHQANAPQSTPPFVPQSSRATYQPFRAEEATSVNGVFALALCGIQSLSVPVEKVVEIQQSADSSGVDPAPRIAVSFKISPRERETVERDFSFTHREFSTHFDLLKGKLYNTDIQVWTAPVLEVWLCWTSRDPSGESLDAHQPVAESRYLLGLARFPAAYKLGSLTSLPIGDVARGVQRGELLIAAVLGRNEGQVETSLQCLLNFHTLRRVSSDAGPRATPANLTPSLETETGMEIGDTEELEECEDSEETKQEHTENILPVNEADDSIDDIVSFLNHHDPQVHFGDLRANSASRHPLSASTSSINEFLAREREVTATTPAAEDEDVRILESEAAASADLAEVTQSERHQTSLHLLDFSIEGAFTAVRPTHSTYSAASIFGCYVQYALPDLASASPNHALWWDGDCAVLNGSLRHQIEIDRVSAASLGEVLGLSSCIKFFFHLADADGNASPDPAMIGEASLSLSELAAFMNSNSGYAVIALPISLHHSTLPSMGDAFEVIAQHPQFLLKASHRVEPVLLRKSVDPTQFAIHILPSSQETPGASDISLQESLDHPSWRIRYDHHSGQTTAATELASHTQLTSERRDAPSEPRRRPDAPSSLLGFELTQEDLDGVMYFRDPSAPLPWVPFEASEPDSRPVLTSALGGRSITVRDGIEVDLDAALKKSIFDLEYIGGMFGHSAAAEAEHAASALPTNPRHSRSGVDSSDSSRDDSDLYKSDFESLDDVDARAIAISYQQSARTSIYGNVDVAGIAANSTAPPLDESTESDNSQYFSDAPPAAMEGESEDSDLEEAIADRVAHLKYLVSEHFKLTDQPVEETKELSVEREYVMAHSDEDHSYHSDGSENNSNSDSAESVTQASGELDVSTSSHRVDEAEALEAPELRECVEEQCVESHSEELVDRSEHSSREASLSDLDALVEMGSGADAVMVEEFAAKQMTDDMRLRFDSPAEMYAEPEEPQSPLPHDLNESQHTSDAETSDQQHQCQAGEDCEGSCGGEGDSQHEEENERSERTEYSSRRPSLSGAIECGTQTEPREANLNLDVSMSVSLLSAQTADASSQRDALDSREVQDETPEDTPSRSFSMHFSLHADPVLDTSGAHELVADRSGLSSVSARHRSAESTRAFGADVTEANRTASDDETDDSPNTSKIRNIVDKQIERVFGSEVFAHAEEYAVPAPYLAQQPAAQSVHHWWNRMDAKPPTALPAAPTKPPTEAELFRANLNKIQALLPVSGAARGGARKHPGWQNRFLDKETDRASNIMNGVFSKSDHV